MRQTNRKVEVVVGIIAIALGVAVLYPTSPLRRMIRESMLAGATSAHYELRYPPGSLSRDSIAKLIAEHEKLFTALDARIGGLAANARIRIIFDDAANAKAGSPPYTVNGSTIRTNFNTPIAPLAPAADAQALLYAAWGTPGNAAIAEWTAHWLVSGWNNDEIGMAAASVEHSLGHMTVTKLLSPQGVAGESAQDRTLLGAAWINAVAEMGGLAKVRALYSAKLARLDLADVSQALGVSPSEVERKWQLWIFAYVAGMPSAPSPGMPMNMPMGK